MKQLLHSVNCLLIAGFTLLFTSCVFNKEEDVYSGLTNEIVPDFSTPTATVLADDSLSITVLLQNYNAQRSLNIKRYGWAWSEAPNPTLDDNALYFTGSDFKFDTVLADLMVGNTYYFRPFYITAIDTVFGNIVSAFMGIAKLNDLNVSSNQACRIQINCSLVSPSQLEDYGIVFNQGSGIPTITQNNGKIQGDGISNGLFICTMNGLEPNTLYTIRSYAVTNLGIGYSPTLEITTPSNNMSLQFGINTYAEVFQGAIIKFTNGSSNVDDYIWNFGEGNNSTEISPTHTFEVLGNIQVRLTGMAGGCVVSKDTIIKVVDDPFKDYFVPIQGGTFTMGCTEEQEPYCAVNENPPHPVTISPFILGKTEVTQAQWKAVVGGNPSTNYQCGDNCPVENVSWKRIWQEFIPALNKKTGMTHRLPREAEWEYAARAGTNFIYAGSNNINLVAQYYDINNLSIQEVAQLQPNNFGLYDMSGNVMEWCNDWFDANYYGNSPQNDPSGPTGSINTTSKVLRGGSYNTYAEQCRVSRRYAINPEFTNQERGFRIVRSNN